MEADASEFVLRALDAGSGEVASRRGESSQISEVTGKKR